MDFELDLTFDDVLLVPKKSIVNSRSEVSLKSKLTKNITLNVPIISSNMDSVTEDQMAISMARMGGLGILHRFCSIKEQVNMVKKVKRAQNIIIKNPYVIPPTFIVKEVKTMMKNSNVGTLLIVDEQKHLLGIVSKRDLHFTKNNQLVTDVATMIGDGKVVTGKPDITVEIAKEIFKKYKIKKIPLVNDNNVVVGLVTSKDIHNANKYPNMVLDNQGRLLVGAAVGVKDDYLERTKALLDVGCDVICIDIAHGHSEIGINAVKTIKEKFPNCELIAGNVATLEGTEELYKAGADCIKVGIGGGSICRTRIVTGFGYPQLGAVINCSLNINIPIIADGGIRTSGDIVKALAAGANTVMLGSMLAGFDESPGDIIDKNGKKCKMIRGMAGTLANISKSERNGENKNERKSIVSEGADNALVEYKGSVYDTLEQLCGGIKSGVSYGGGKDLDGLREKAEFIRVTSAGKIENGLHDIKLN